jgi:polysaccharide export outer membrane protein
MTSNALIVFLFLFLTSSCCPSARGQQFADSKSAATPTSQPGSASLVVRGATADYMLGPQDQIEVSVPGLEEQFNDKVFRIDSSGGVTLPLVGRIHVAGMTASALEGELRARLRPILKNPEAVVSISSFGSQPVSVLGAVRNPGIVQLQGRRTLFEVLSLAGGLQPEAGYVVQVTRSLDNGTIPLANVAEDRNANVSVASVRLKDIINVPNAAENIEIRPGDTIAVPKAGVVYVVGSVVKPGGFTLDENESLSALQAVSLAEGLQSTAASSKARVLRPVPGSPNRDEIPVDLHRLMSGKTSDTQLHAGDILFVPGSGAKKAGIRTLDAIVNAATYASVYAAH